MTYCPSSAVLFVDISIDRDEQLSQSKMAELSLGQTVIACGHVHVLEPEWNEKVCNSESDNSVPRWIVATPPEKLVQDMIKGSAANIF